MVSNRPSQSRAYVAMNPGLLDALKAASVKQGLSQSTILRKCFMIVFKVDANGEPRAD